MIPDTPRGHNAITASLWEGATHMRNTKEKGTWWWKQLQALKTERHQELQNGTREAGKSLRRDHRPDGPLGFSPQELILDFWPSDLWKVNLCCFKPPHLQYFVTLIPGRQQAKISCNLSFLLIPFKLLHEHSNVQASISTNVNHKLARYYIKATLCIRYWVDFKIFMHVKK